MGLPNNYYDTRQQDGVFPISGNEAAALHDMGWNSGYGWKNQWDWWHEDLPISEQEDSREWDSTKERFMRHLFAIRAARNEADEIVRLYFRQPGEEWAQQMGSIEVRDDG